jgi:hypothetical protein
VGGLNTYDSPYTIQDTESRDCLNVVGTLRGAIQKRRGSTQFLAATPPAVEMTGLTSVNIGGTRYLIAFGANKIYSINTSGVPTDITGTASVTSGSRWSVVEAPISTAVANQGPVYMSNGIDAPLQWSGSGNVAPWTAASGSDPQGNALGPLPNGAYLCYHQNRIWVAGVASAPSTLFFSGLLQSGVQGTGDPSSWPTINVAQFDVSDGYPITGLGDVGAYLLVTKELKSWVVVNPVSIAVRQLSHNIGCISHRSICATQEGTFFLTPTQGVFVTTGTTATEASYKIRPTILNITQSARQNACAGTFGNHYYLSFPWGGSTINNRTIDYDMQLKAWWLHDIAANEMAVHEVGQALLYVAVPGVGNGVAQVGVPGVYTDFGKPYVGGPFGMSAYWCGAWQRFYEYFMRHRIQMPMVKKRIRQIYFNGQGVITPMVFKNFKPGNAQYYPGVVNNGNQWQPMLPIQFGPNYQLYANPDTAQLYGGTTYKGVQMIWGGASAVGDARIYSLGTAEEWSVGFGNNTADWFEVDAYAYASQMRKS